MKIHKGRELPEEEYRIQPAATGEGSEGGELFKIFLRSIAWKMWYNGNT